MAIWRGDDLRAVVPAATTSVNLPGNLVEVDFPMPAKLTKQRRREETCRRGRDFSSSTSGASGLQLFTVAALPADAAVRIFGHPHREHFAAFVCQSDTPDNAETGRKSFSRSARWFKPRRRVGGLAGFRAAWIQSQRAGGVYTNLVW